MDVSSLTEHLAADGPVFAAAAAHSDWDAPVPRTDWTVRQLVTHLGGVQRWAADIIETGSATGATAAGAAVGIGPRDADLVEWFLDGHRALVEALSSAPADLDCFTFLPADSPLHFWARRQAHEMAIHRADAQAAARHGVTAFDTDFAQDGIAEMLLGFAARRTNAIDRAATLALRPNDEGPPWLVRLGGERIAAERGDPSDADVTVAGTSSELYLWLWNRTSLPEVTGDAQVAALWQNVRVRWS
ncbi:MAG TPA: maleylpyruvate isomerase family mycothiol-dependent enzyme [Jatrophihabitans sp.]|nr:maleylpyruvate isomerase family mycothiol-dependent enzyme [Jatrophihabitans sp.]